MEFNYFYGQQSDTFTFYRIPKVLFNCKRFSALSTDAKLLYGILLDRMNLSAKNNWTDENKRVYIYFTLQNIREAMDCGENKAVKLLDELDRIGLIERKRQGLGKPNMIYVKNFISADSEENKENNGNEGQSETAVSEEENRKADVPKQDSAFTADDEPETNVSKKDENGFYIAGDEPKKDENGFYIAGDEPRKDENGFYIVEDEPKKDDLPDIGNNSLKKDENGFYIMDDDFQTDVKAEVKKEVTDEEKPLPFFDLRDPFAKYDEKEFLNSQERITETIINEAPDFLKEKAIKNDLKDTYLNYTDSSSGTEDGGKALDGQIKNGEKVKLPSCHIQIEGHPEIYNYQTCRRYFWVTLECRIFLINYPSYKNMLMSILDLIVETVCSTKKTIRVAGDYQPAEVVRERFLCLTPDQLQFVMMCYKQRLSGIRNVKQYLLTSLFNAPLMTDAYYSALVAHDLRGEPLPDFCKEIKDIM